MHSLALFGRATRGEPFVRDITRIARGWRRSSRAVRGYNVGSFAIEPRDMTVGNMERFFEHNLGYVVQEHCAAQLSWEGIILEMRLVVDGVERMASLDPEYCHNKVDILCAYPPAVDTEQGGPYAWDPADPLDSFQDQGQDFSEWESNPAGANAAYRLRVVATDGTVIWGYMGLAFTTTSANDSVYIYEYQDLSDEGWAVENVPGGRGSKVVATYTIEATAQAVGPHVLGWQENADSIEEYGEIAYIETAGNVPPDTAAMLQQRHLSEFAWPRPRLVGGVTAGGGRRRDRDGLTVAVAGFWHTTNWRYLSTSSTARARTALETLAGLTEFVGAGRMEMNDVAAYLNCLYPQRLGDLMEGVINLGDASYSPWQGGVYEDRELIFEQAPSTVDYTLANNVLMDKGGRRVLFPLVKPGILVQMGGGWGGQPVGSSNLWDDPSVAYIDQVEYVAPDQLRLAAFTGEMSIITLMEQVRQAEPADRWPESPPGH